MNPKTEMDEAQILDSFKICRDEVKHEYGVLANRLNSYITSQAFLVSGYAISMGNLNPHWNLTFTLLFPLLLSMVAVLLSVRAHPGITSACDIIRRWHERQDELFKFGKGLDDYGILQHNKVRNNHESNLWFAQTSAWIFGVAWFLMAVLAIYLHAIR